ncbi:hypothetical protein [Undibacterium sp. TS12]|uniref:hypothetical protein n=1 Tax=Undibacterium sp. TS12 TaxID=2908202 RepID=UPI001F4CC68D|nr:hypothetical protein [Undibacterium sp. TS12]MCH8618858.1 hypothetical protein [Undibacterium sp. TS12]
MKQFSKYVGLDVHKATVAVSVARAGGEVRYVREIANTADVLKKTDPPDFLDHGLYQATQDKRLRWS